MYIYIFLFLTLITTVARPNCTVRNTDRPTIQQLLSLLQYSNLVKSTSSQTHTDIVPNRLKTEHFSYSHDILHLFYIYYLQN